MTRVGKLAKLLCDYSLKIKKDDLVLIRGEMCAEPLIRECFKEILKKGAHPLVRMSFPEQSAVFYKYGSDHQFQYVSEVDKIQAETVTAQIAIDSTDNTKELTSADPSKVSMQQKVRGDLREKMFARESEGKFSWVVAPFPTRAMAQDAEMSFEEYEDFVYNACKLNEADPVAAWQAVDRFQADMVKKLTGSHEIRLIGDKTDIKFNIQGRKWISCCGERNMPDGEIYTSPVENSASGHVYFDLPTNYYGIEAQGIYLKLENGKIIEAKAEKGEDFLEKILKTDEGASFIGEVAFGLNNNILKPSKNILFDEKIGQTMHIAVGASYTEAGGKNKSAVHWDLIKSMKEGSYVELDGKVIYKDGKFLI